MTTITAEDVAEELTWADNEWIKDGLYKAGIWAEKNVVHIEVKQSGDCFHAIVRPGKHEEPLSEEPKVYKAAVMDDYGDVWQRHGDDVWHCAIDGDEFSAWPWDRLVKEMGPITLIHLPQEV
jgi:hypothetical protein